ncbi:MAG: GNAT family N-acetyltransferase [Cytophagaceae bacterium]|jgi:hypothetical protein|nr:GNAT family N-acetyltransferase [Cytophagaceae bacterium]
MKNISVSEVGEREWLLNLNEYAHSLFITAEWVNAMQSGNSKAVFYNFVDGGTVVGKLSGLINNRYLYCYASPALKVYEQNMFDACHVALYRYALKQKYLRIVLGSYDQQHELACRAKGFFTTNRFEYIVDFRPTAGELHFSKGFKKNVKHAEKNSISFIQSDSDDVMKKLFTLLNLTREHRVSKYGTQYNPFYLQNMDEQSLTRLLNSGIVKLYYVLFENEIHSVQYNIEKNGQVYGLLMGSNNKAYELGFPSYIDFNMIQRFRDGGFKYYNPGGGTDDSGNEGIEKYKHSMGGTKVFVHGATTNYIVFPQKILNFLLNIGRMLPRKNPAVKLLKRMIG